MTLMTSGGYYMNGSVLKGITSLTLISLLTGGFLRDFDPNDLPFSASNTINLHGSEYVLQEDLLHRQMVVVRVVLEGDH